MEKSDWKYINNICIREKKKIKKRGIRVMVVFVVANMFFSLRIIISNKMA